MSSSSKPAVLYAVPPREGHMRPALQICTYLVSRGFDVTILGSSKWRPAIESIGATFGPIIGFWNSLDEPSRWPSIALEPDARKCLRASLGDGFTFLLPSGFQSVWFTLAVMRQRLGKGKIIIMTDTCFSGTMPFKLGTDLPPGFGVGEIDDIKTLGIGVVPSHWVSPERPPWGSGLPFDDSPAGRHRNLAAHREAYDPTVEERARMILTMLNCTKSVDTILGPYTRDDLERPFWDAVTLVNDTTLQMGLASLEYPAEDWPSHLKFAGTLPLKPIPDDLEYPDWWDEIMGNSAKGIASDKGRKRIILVAQGTEVTDYNRLVVPTIEALAERPDIIVVTILCVREANLDGHLSSFPGGTLPSNVKVLDYFPYDAVLAHADIFVSNSGYGGLSHAVANGVPLLQSGNEFDKADIGRRVEYAGLGVYLVDPPPLAADVRKAVDEILGNEKYIKRARELKLEAAAARPLETVEREIMALS